VFRHNPNTAPGAKHVYLDPGDLPTVKEIDWQHLPEELEAAVLQSLRWRLVQVLAGHDWRTMRPHRVHIASTSVKTTRTPGRV